MKKPLKCSTCTFIHSSEISCSLLSSVSEKTKKIAYIVERKRKSTCFIHKFCTCVKLEHIQITPKTAGKLWAFYSFICIIKPKQSKKKEVWHIFSVSFEGNKISNDLTFSKFSSLSQNHRKVWFGSDLQRPSSSTPLGQGHLPLDQLAKAPSNVALNTSREWASTNSLDRCKTLMHLDLLNFIRFAHAHLPVKIPLDSIPSL